MDLAVALYLVQPAGPAKALTDFEKKLAFVRAAPYSAGLIRAFRYPPQPPWPLSRDMTRMAADSSSQLQGLLDRMRAGDAAARDELIGRAYVRLGRLAHKMLGGFPRLRSI